MKMINFRIVFFTIVSLSIGLSMHAMNTQNDGALYSYYGKKPVIKSMNIVIENKTGTILTVTLTNTQPARYGTVESSVNPKASAQLEYPCNFNMISDLFAYKILKIMSSGYLEISAKRANVLDNKYIFHICCFPLIEAVTDQNIINSDQLINLADSCNSFTLKVTVAGPDYNQSTFSVTADSIKSLKDIALSKVVTLIQDRKLILIKGRNITNDLHEEIIEYLKKN
jgi:hypothetical protein